MIKKTMNKKLFITFGFLDNDSSIVLKSSAFK